MPKACKRTLFEPGESSIGGAVSGSRKSRLLSALSSRLLLSSLPMMTVEIAHVFANFVVRFFWYAKRVLSLSRSNHPCYNHCCKSGSVILPYPLSPPPAIAVLYGDATFIQSIRAYNIMFSMTSLAAVVDKEINKGSGPSVFKVSGQISHWIGSLCPEDGKGPRFLQLYIVDTEHELSNRLRAFDDPSKPALDERVIATLIRELTLHNEYVRTFKTAKEIVDAAQLDSYAVCLFNNVPDRNEPPSSVTLGCIVCGDDSAANKYDIIVYSKSGHPQQVSKLHPTYMALQYPLLFRFGEDGWSLRMKLCNETGSNARNLTVNMYYAYHIHARSNIYSLVLNSCRLFQQYLVDAYTCIEQSRLDYFQSHQDQLRSEYVSGIYDAISNGDTESRSVGKRVLLPPSFTGGPRYMYSHYQDALSICRVYGNPQYFITFTCNVNWPEIRRYMDFQHQHDTHSRADIIARVFRMKVKSFITFLKEDKTFETVIAHLYTIEFQKRGLPHCHTLLWVSD
ncbi:uncharacterized protein LOC111887346 isoform X1 [Lactuca sativa]|uniref:uncharacterized protein LOC111887346 isoform X1 n=2 Tax=Lactuca sativa TaxID=4236 RepID=UPI000CD8E20D|nr:uncharacterized protein LOC111887346 isoform X1 [Lactuca sativa]